MGIQLHRFGKGKAAKVGGARDTYRPHKSLDEHAWSLTYPTYSSKRPEKKGGGTTFILYTYIHIVSRRTGNITVNCIRKVRKIEGWEDTICIDRLFLMKAAKGNL